jgi:hypothetical protein
VSGFLIWQLRPIGALCLLVGGLGIAWLGPRSYHRARASTGVTAGSLADGTISP